MARKADLDATLERLVELRRDPTADGAVEELRAILGGKLSHAIARAADIVGNAQLRDLEPDLVEAYERLAVDPLRRDPACRGKTALVEALQLLDASEGDLYLRAARTVQLEPVYGGKQDMAPELRGAAGRGLVRMNHADALLVLAEMLADPELAARMAAVSAVAAHGGSAVLPLLRLKALVGDPEADVVGDCLLALLQISPEDSIEFVDRFLQGEHGAGEFTETALFALGESRAPQALQVLRRYWERCVDRDLSQSALLAVAMMRSDDAIEWLLSLVASEAGPTARDAIQAFEIHRNDERLVARLRDQIDARKDVDLTQAFEDALL